MNQKYIAHAAVFGANLFYAGNYVIAKEVVPVYIGAYGMIVIRVVISTVLFWALSKFLIKDNITDKRDYWHLLLCSIFGVALN